MDKILLLEDDESLGFIVKDSLESKGYNVQWKTSGDQGLASYKQNKPDICLVDVMMPNMDGFEFATELRKKDEFIPILFITAKSQEEDRLKGFEIGGDDYIIKPFSMKELTYRINVFLRRSIPQKPEPTDPIQFGSSCFDPVNIILKVDDIEYSLTQMEGQLLKMLLGQINTLVKREDILEGIWGENDYFKGRSLDVFITRLRKYFKTDNKIEIKNHHGVGFSLMVENE